MKKILGILGLLLFICAVTALESDRFLLPNNLQNIARWTGLFGILSIGVAFVIITGGIDLSIGSVVGLVGCMLPWLLVEQGWGVGGALVMVLATSVLIGLSHGLMITKLGLQPFIVTLCGLLIYRGMARYLTDDQSVGFGTEYAELRGLATGEPFMVPSSFLIMLAIGLLAAVFLNKTVWGRYLFALGRNELAARYSGIRTDRMVILAYVVCSLLAGIGGILFALDINSMQPSNHGNFFELYAIAAAVLGGCSLRGGQGAIAGVIIGAAVMRVLYNSITLLGIPDHLEFAIIGMVLLLGVTADELIRRFIRR